MAALRRQTPPPLLHRPTRSRAVDHHGEIATTVVGIQRLKQNGIFRGYRTHVSSLTVPAADAAPAFPSASTSLATHGGDAIGAVVGLDGATAALRCASGTLRQDADQHGCGISASEAVTLPCRIAV